MIQRSFSPPPGPRLHVAIIMDGNGRWAATRGLPRSDGHRAGAGAVRRTVEGAAALGVGTLTLYAFSADNWKRPPTEVALLMRLFRESLEREVEGCVRDGVRLSVVGRRDRLDPSLVRTIEAAEAATTGGPGLHLRIAIDYSGRDAIVAAASRARNGGTPCRESFSLALAEAMHVPGALPDVDLLIRTGGEKRLSDFLLWECAYAELHFLDLAWPEFGAEELASAIGEFSRRDRRFGGLPPAGHARESRDGRLRLLR